MAASCVSSDSPARATNSFHAISYQQITRPLSGKSGAFDAFLYLPFNRDTTYSVSVG